MALCLCVPRLQHHPGPLSVVFLFCFWHVAGEGDVDVYTAGGSSGSHGSSCSGSPSGIAPFSTSDDGSCSGCGGGSSGTESELDVDVPPASAASALVLSLLAVSLACGCLGPGLADPSLCFLSGSKLSGKRTWLMSPQELTEDQWRAYHHVVAKLRGWQWQQGRCSCDRSNHRHCHVVLFSKELVGDVDCKPFRQVNCMFFRQQAEVLVAVGGGGWPEGVRVCKNYWGYLKRYLDAVAARLPAGGVGGGAGVGGAAHGNVSDDATGDLTDWPGLSRSSGFGDEDELAHWPVSLGPDLLHDGSDGAEGGDDVGPGVLAHPAVGAGDGCGAGDGDAFDALCEKFFQANPHLAFP
jgi:hypothetical protein